jgi:hypothetical protein
MEGQFSAQDKETLMNGQGLCGHVVVLYQCSGVTLSNFKVYYGSNYTATLSEANAGAE